MKIKISIDNGDGKAVELEIDEPDRVMQAVLVQNVFDLFNVDADLLDKGAKMNKIEKMYYNFFSNLEQMEESQTKINPKEIQEKMIRDFNENREELINTYQEKNDTPEFVKTGIKIRDGKEFYRTHYKCPKCEDKGTLYISLDFTHVRCRGCNDELAIQLATNDPFPARDTFGNFLVAGEFKDRNIK